MVKKGEQTRELILQCAEKVFSAKGYYKTSISDIVKLAHVARGTIYFYFDNKDNLFITLLNRYLHQWKKVNVLDLKELTCDKTISYYTIELLRQRLRKTIDYWAENPARTNIILKFALGLNIDAETIIRSFEEIIQTVIIGDIRFAQKWGNISNKIDVDIACNAILGITIRFLYQSFVFKINNFNADDRLYLENKMLILISNLLGINAQETQFASNC